MAILHRPNSLNNRTPRQVVANFTILEIAIKSCLFIHVISLQVIYLMCNKTLSPIKRV